MIPSNFNREKYRESANWFRDFRVKHSMVPTCHAADAEALYTLLADMAERDRLGRERYGTPLQAGNGRNPLVDAYQEGLDMLVYLRQAAIEGHDVAELYEDTLRLVGRLRWRMGVRA